MILKKLKISLICCTLSIGILGSVANKNKSYADYKNYKEIRVAFNQNEKHPQYIAMKHLGEEFEKKTNGRYKMKIYANGVLGSQNEVAEFIRTGALQMAIVPSSVPESYDSDFAIVGAPYLYKDMNHMERALNKGIFDKLFASTKKYNFQVLTIYTAGERNVYSKKPINSAKDLKGQIIRVNNSPTYVEMTKLMGGTGAVMAQSEVYTALQQGVIDAGENSELVYNDFKHYEVAPYYSYTKHIVHPDVVIASNDFLDTMDNKDKEIFRKLVRESSNYEFKTFAKKIKEAKVEIAKHGTKFCYPDTNELRKLNQPLLDKIANKSKNTKKIYNEINSLR